MDYRILYEEKTKTKIPKNFDIHHIDGNRNNNEITNLVALPKKIHSKYHELSLQFKNKNFKPNIEILSIFSNGYGFNSYYKLCYNKFYKIYKDCQKYVDYRDYLLNKIPDLHTIGLNYGIKK